MKKIAYFRTNEIYLDSRATKEIFALVEDGNEVYVFAWNRYGDAIEKCQKIFQNSSDKIHFYFYENPTLNGIGIKNIDKLIGWFRWSKKSLQKYGTFDVVHMCDLDSAFGVWKSAKKSGASLVYDIYDYYIDCHHVPKIIEHFVEKQEINVINNVDVTIICNEARCEQIQKSTPKKLVIIHNSPDVDIPIKDDEEFDYVYFGDLTDRRLVGRIIEKYPDNSDMKMVFGGLGPRQEDVQNLADSYDNFSYFGRISYSEVLKFESKSKILSAIYDPSIRNHRLCAPNKFYEAIALNKPIIVCKGTGIDKIVDSNNLGLTINYDESEFYTAVRYLLDNPEICKEMGQNGRKIYEDKYSWNLMKNILIDIYRNFDEK